MTIQGGMTHLTEKCSNCGITIEWKLDETRSKNRMWEKSEWHKCDPKNTTIVNIKPIWWFCMECLKKIDIESHPCLHYQKLNPTERALTRVKAKC